MLNINHVDLDKLIQRHYEVGQPLFIFGAVGIGKSEGIRESARELSKRYEREYLEWTKLTESEKKGLLNDDKIKHCFLLGDLRASQLEPSDLQIPDISSTSAYLERKYDLLFKVVSNPNAKGILFFDELNLAPPSLQAALYQIINDNEFGDLKLSDGMLRIGAGNQMEDGVNVFDMGAALHDRFSLFILDAPAVEDWEDWALHNSIDPRIISFLHFKPSYMHRQVNNKNKDIVQPTPRSWEKVSLLINGITNYDDIEQLASGRVGEGIAIEFTAFCKLSEKIDIKAILAHPDKAKLPDRQDMLYSLVSGIVDIYQKKKSKNTLKNILTISTRLSTALGEQGGAEFGVLLLRLIRKVSPSYFNNVLKMKEWDKVEVSYGKYLRQTE